VCLDLVTEGFAWVDDHWFDGRSWFFLISVPVGVTLAWLIARWFAPEVEGDGVAEVEAAVAVHGGYLPTRSIPFKILATSFTLGGGGSGGREGPIAQIGGAIGSAISRRFHLGEDQVRSLLAAGAAAGISASFNAPIAGMLFGLEVILGSFAVRHMSAVVLASVAASVTLDALAPAEILRGSTYTLGDPRELLLYAGLAVLGVVAAVLLLRLLDLLADLAARFERRAWLRPVLLGVAVGALGMVDSRLLGTGQDFVQELLTSQVLEEEIEVVSLAAGTLLLLALGKIVATALTLGSGGSAGAFMPSLFIGASLGAGFAKLVDPVWGVSEILPGAFAVVGMATVFSAVARAPLTAILIVIEVTGAREYGLVLPLMLAAVFASFVADRVHPESAYTMPLRRRGITPVTAGEVDVLDTVTVGEVMTSPETNAAPGWSLEEADETMVLLRTHGLPVVEAGRLVGVVTTSDLDNARRRGERTVGEAMTARPATVGPGTAVSQALQRMAVLGIGRLPVVADHDATRLVGLFRRGDAIRAYHLALGRATGRQLDRDRLRQRTDPRAGFFDFRVPPGSIADGAAVQSIDWAGSTLVSIRRGTGVVVPTGDTVLVAGDVVTAFGTDEARPVVIDRLNEGADEPTAEIPVVDPGSHTPTE
jgi:CIC family chloride channel protein